MEHKKSYKKEPTQTKEELHNRLQIEINSNKIFIDKSVFKKTPEEKVAFKIAKAKYRSTLNIN